MFFFKHPGCFSYGSSPWLLGLLKCLAKIGGCRLEPGIPGVRPALEYQFAEQEMPWLR
jgi:hypothetical protein